MGFILKDKHWLFLFLMVLVCLGQSACKADDLFSSPKGPVLTAPPSKVLFKKRQHSVFGGQYGWLAGDASVIKEGKKFLMAYTCHDAYRKIEGTALCIATSDDGIDWKHPDKKSKTWGRVAKPSEDDWDRAQETSFLLNDKSSHKHLLYYVGYKGDGFFFSGADVGLAISEDGKSFTRLEEPIIRRGKPGSLDSFGITSPSIVQHSGVYHMLYVGWCMENCPSKAITHLMYASSKDGVRWEKHGKLNIDFHDTPFAFGVAEPEMLLGPDKKWYVFFTSTEGRHVIGIARSYKLTGPWEIRKEPVFNISSSEFDASGALAPSVLVDGDKVRMWFNGQHKNKINIGYAEAAWPLQW